MHAPIRVGIIGAGVSATTFHAPFIVSHPSFKLVKFLRNSPVPVNGHDAVPVITDLGQFLRDPPEIDLVVITTPTHSHYDLAKACLEADKHVVLEKPMCPSFDEAQELCAESRAQNKLLAVYQNRRWDGDFLTVSQLIKYGALGRVVELESHFDRFRNVLKPGWKEQDLPGSGVLYDLGAHLIDQALCLFGAPSGLTAHITNQRQLPGSTVPDAFTVTLHYEAQPQPQVHTQLPSGIPSGIPGPSQPGHQGLTVILRASMLAKQPGARFTVHGTQGSYIKHGMDVQEGQLRAGLAPTDPGFGVEGPEGFGTLDSLALQVPGPASVGAGGGSSKSGRGAGGAAAVDVSSIAAGVLAKLDTGDVVASSGSSSGGAGAQEQSAVVKVVTERGCWVEFYDGVANILLGGRSSTAAAAADAPAGAGPGSSSSSSGDLNSRLAVPPEQAAQVIRLIEAAMQSSREGRTVQL